MKTLMRLRTLVFICLLNFFIPIKQSNAAFPIPNKECSFIKSSEKKLTTAQIEEGKMNLNITYPNPETKKEDDGIFGILSLVFGLVGIFPAAIVLGIIGMEERRKYKGLAIAGFSLGVMSLLVFLFAVGLITYFL
jgi:hypothetical protein